MNTLRIVGMVVGWVVLFVAVIGAYWKLRMQIQAMESDIKSLEKEYIKELNDVDDKLERVFAVLKKYLTLDKHEDLDRITKMEIKEEIRNAADDLGEKVKADTEQTMTNFAELFGKKFDEMQKAIKANGKP